MREYSVSAFTQPAGEFWLASIPAPTVIEIAKVEQRAFDVKTLSALGGIQRESSAKRIARIAEYCATADAAFPTPIILALPSNTYQLDNSTSRLTLDHGRNFASVVDGQHRLRGLEKSGHAERFQLAVVFLLEATQEQQALLFATVNGTQTRVPASLIYDLFGVTLTRSPQRTAHEVARTLNASATSPWHRKLKMLGKTSGLYPGESLTQGTFVAQLLPLISTRPDLDFAAARLGEPFREDPAPVLRKYFLADDDASIVKLLTNVFEAQRAVWPAEWNNPDEFILTKTTGFMATMRALPELVQHGQLAKDLTQEHFERVFGLAKNKLQAEGLGLRADSFASSSAGINELRDFFQKAAQEQSRIMALTLRSDR